MELDQAHANPEVKIEIDVAEDVKTAESWTTTDDNEVMPKSEMRTSPSLSQDGTDPLPSPPVKTVPLRKSDDRLRLPATSSGATTKDLEMRTRSSASRSVDRGRSADSLPSSSAGITASEAKPATSTSLLSVDASDIKSESDVSTSNTYDDISFQAFLEQESPVLEIVKTETPVIKTETQVRLEQIHVETNEVPEGAMFPCLYCTAVFFARSNLAEHVQTHVQSKFFSCLECNTSFGSPTALKRHTIKKHGLNQPHFLCCYCCQAFFTEREMKQHMSVHTGKKPFPCSQCGLGFNYPGSLNKHKITKHPVSETRPFPCSDCAASFFTRHRLKEHRMIHTGEKNFICPQCNVAFRHANSLKGHILRIHSVKQLNVPCPHCEKMFMTTFERNKHIRTHTNEKPFLCTWCGARFAFAGGLRIHSMRKHQERKALPCRCKDCPAAFVTNFELKKHRFIHNHDGEKRFICEDCKAPFTRSFELKHHIMREHKPDRPFLCPMCPAAFQTSSHLKRHSFIHSKVKPFQCTQCEATFTQLGNFKSHWTRVHAQNRVLTPGLIRQMSMYVRKRLTKQQPATQNTTQQQPVTQNTTEEQFVTLKIEIKEETVTPEELTQQQTVTPKRLAQRQTVTPKRRTQQKTVMQSAKQAALKRRRKQPAPRRRKKAGAKRNYRSE